MSIGHKCKLCHDTGMIPVGRSGSSEDGNAIIYEDCDCGIIEQMRGEPSPDDLRKYALISCRTCRKCKDAQLQQHFCDHRGNFNAVFDDNPCENWLPSKKSVKIWIERLTDDH